jgi:hypothetical protein
MASFLSLNLGCSHHSGRVRRSLQALWTRRLVRSSIRRIGQEQGIRIRQLRGTRGCSTSRRRVERYGFQGEKVVCQSSSEEEREG